MSDYRSDYRAGDSSVTLRNWSFAINILYLLGSVTGVFAIVGVIMAHMKVNQADPLWRSHFAFQIRTFWWSLLFALVSCVLMLVVIGFFLIMLVPVWVVLRSIISLLKTANNEPIPAPHSLLLGL